MADFDCTSLARPETPVTVLGCDGWCVLMLDAGGADGGRGRWRGSLELADGASGLRVLAAGYSATVRGLLVTAAVHLALASE